jgi:hypothetical protein
MEGPKPVEPGRRMVEPRGLWRSSLTLTASEHRRSWAKDPPGLGDVPRLPAANRVESLNGGIDVCVTEPCTATEDEKISCNCNCNPQSKRQQ